MLKQEIEDGQHGLADPAFRADVLNGLTARPRAIPARWFYDRRGSELFDEITRLPAYYPTRTETGMLEHRMPEIARLIAPACAVVEFGAGSATKTPILLRAVQPKAYVPVDISGDYLRESAEVVDRDFPGLAVHPVEADFTREMELPKEIDGMSRLGFFPGSTIGNFVPRSATDLLRDVWDENADPLTKTVQVTLRRKLGDTSPIETTPGVGYRTVDFGTVGDDTVTIRQHLGA